MNRLQSPILPAVVCLLCLPLHLRAQDVQPGAAVTAEKSPEASTAPPEAGGSTEAADAGADEGQGVARLFEQEPYDLITLDAANDNEVLTVLPLQLPDRQLPPESKRVGKLTLRLFDNPGEEYEVMWRNIAKVELFEELVLKQANLRVEEAMARSTAGENEAGQRLFDEAFEYFRFLLNFHPGTSGLQELVRDYLYLNAGSLFRCGRAAEAFAILEELDRQDPQYRFRGSERTAQLAMESVGDALVESYSSAGDYRAARSLLERLGRDYGDRLAFVTARRTGLIALAEAKRDEAQRHLAGGRLREAHEVSREMLKIWPAVAEAAALLEEVARRYPLILVGVSTPALQAAPESLVDPAARRAGELMYATLVQYARQGPEGGIYSSPWGAMRQSDDRRQLIFDLHPPESLGGLTGYDLARRLLAVADPVQALYQPAWAGLVAGVQVDGVSQVRVDLRRPSVLPQAYLQTRAELADPAWTRYTIASRSEDETRFEPVQGGDSGTRADPVIVEKYYADPRKAIEDLRKGKLDLVDRLLPNDALRLAQDQSLTVARYAFPSIHALVPNPENEFLQNRVFRRALLYAINRSTILNKGLLNGRTLEGCREITAPLAAGLSADDAAYAYDERLEPRPFDPVMATILLRLAEQQWATAAEQRKEPVPELGELVLAHPAGELPRFVCQQIQSQWELVGVKSALKELPAGVCLPDAGYDLLFMEFHVREPFSDIGRILGSGGAIPTLDPYVSLALRQVEQAENWKDVRERLQTLHRLLYEEVTVLPLWQLVDHFVYQRGLQGVRDRAVFLYEGVADWRVTPSIPQD